MEHRDCPPTESPPVPSPRRSGGAAMVGYLAVVALAMLCAAAIGMLRSSQPCVSASLRLDTLFESPK